MNKFYLKNKKDQKGYSNAFTLIELIIVIAIIGVIYSVVSASSCSCSSFSCGSSSSKKNGGDELKNAVDAYERSID